MTNFEIALRKLGTTDKGIAVAIKIVMFIATTRNISDTQAATIVYNWFANQDMNKINLAKDAMLANNQFALNNI